MLVTDDAYPVPAVLAVLPTLLAHSLPASATGRTPVNDATQLNATPGTCSVTVGVLGVGIDGPTPTQP